MSENTKVCTITCTSGRHYQMERTLRYLLEQDYPNVVHLIYQNSFMSQRLNRNLDPEKFILVNNARDMVTGKPYTNLGAIYRDALSFVPKDVDLVTFSDDDDLYSPDHISQGVKGYLKGKTINPSCRAYKPGKSYFKTREGTTLASNTMEPSIFVEKSHVDQHGFYTNTSSQHLMWVEALGNDIFIDPEGKPTFWYTWLGEDGVWKTSGDERNPENFNNYLKHSRSWGDLILTPISKAEADKFLV